MNSSINAVRSLIIDFANQNGIDLSSEFKTAEDFKLFVISFCIKTLVSFGYSTNQAYDVVHGDGAYQQMADSVWDSLKAA